MLFYIAFVLLYIPFIILFPTKVIHKKRLPKGKAILTSNHYSNLDPLVLLASFGKWFRFVAKKELFKNKFLGFILKNLGVIPIDREAMSPSSFKEIMGNLKKDRQVFIFPEGTRNKGEDENLQDVKKGVITFASKGECQIVPMIIYQKPKVFRKNYIIVGEPITLEAENVKRLSKEEQEASLEKYIAAMNDLRAELDDFVASKKRKKKKSKQ